MRTHYFGHEKQYQQRKAEGRPGWGTAEDIAESIAAIKAVLETGEFAAAAKVLELGCGAGDNSLWLAEQGYDVSGVDIAPTAIAWATEKAQQKGLQAHFTVGDVLHLTDFADDSFDFVLDGSCLHCIIGEDRQRFLASALRVLKPGGRLFSMTMCNDPVSAGLRRNFDLDSRCQVFGDIAVRYCGLPEDIQGEFEAVGFQVVHASVQPHQDENSEDILYLLATRPSRRSLP